MTVRLGLIGAGRMGRVFARRLSFDAPGADLVAVADLNVAQATRVAEEAGIRRVYADPARLLADPGIDAVLIASPTSTHVDLVVAAAQHGKHVFCEKPLALTVEGCDRALAAVREAGVKLQVGFMRRFDRAYQQARQAIEAGLIGTPVLFKSVGRDPQRTDLEYARRENSGGLIMDMAIHDFDLARWLMGDEVVRVHSEGECLVYPELREVGDIDNAVIMLRFEGGALGTVDVSRNAVYGYDIRTEVLGSGGGLVIGQLQATALLLMTRDGVRHDTIASFNERFAEAYGREIQAFVECIEKDLPPPVGGEDARAATAICVAATRSLDEGRPVGLAEVL